MTPDQAEAYRPHLDTLFTLTDSCALRLEEIQAFEDAATLGFALRFSGPREMLLSQGIRDLDHPILGSLSLFLVPVQGQRPDRYTYEAVFNRLKAQATPNGGA